MVENTQERIQSAINDFQARINRLYNEPDYDAKIHMANDKETKLSRLPSFKELSHARGLHPDILYQHATKLLVDRYEVEEKLLIPMRRTIAAFFQFQTAVVHRRSLIPDDERPVSEIADEALIEILAQLMLIARNLTEYEADPTSRPNDSAFSELIQSIRNL